MRVPLGSAAPSTLMLDPNHTIPPVMTELKKRRHHYVPQFWIRRFTDANGKLLQWDGSRAKEIGAASIMQEEWLNTVYDRTWQPSDSLENALSQAESDDAKLFRTLDSPSTALTEAIRVDLCGALALQACRHRDILFGGHRKAGALADLIGDAPLYDLQDQFVSKMTALGVPKEDSQAIHSWAKNLNDPDAWAAEAAKIKAMSPQDPQLPMTEALLAMGGVNKALMKLSYELLDAPATSHFVLGDTPLAQSGLEAGFTVPLSKTLAVRAHVPTPGVNPVLTRRTASASEVIASNQSQWAMAAKIVVGPDAAVFTPLT